MSAITDTGSAGQPTYRDWLDNVVNLVEAGAEAVDKIKKAVGKDKAKKDIAKTIIAANQQPEQPAEDDSGKISGLPSYVVYGGAVVLGGAALYFALRK